MDSSALQKLIVAIPAILFAVTYHEIAHGWVANRLGDPTARMLGRLSPNPIKHIDPVGTVIVPIVMHLMGGPIFGWAKPVPVNPLNLRNPRRDMAIVAAAGPAANLAMAFLAMILMRIVAAVLGLGSMVRFIGDNGLGGLFGAIEALISHRAQGALEIVMIPVFLVLLYLVFLNVLLAIFNMIPIPPLDGGRVLVGLLPREAARKVAAIEPYGFFIIIGLLWLNPLGLWSSGLWKVCGLVVSVLFW